MHFDRARGRTALLVAAVLAAVPALLSSPSPAFADTHTWNVLGSGTWATAANWSPASVPAAGDTVTLLNSDATTRTVTYNATTSAALGAFTIDSTSTSSAYFTLSQSANFFSAGNEYIGYTAATGKGYYLQTGGTHTVTGTSGLCLGYSAGASGTYSLSGSALLQVSYSEYVGYNGSGLFRQSGGTHSIAGLNGFRLGYLAGSAGTYSLSGSALLDVSNSVYVGYEGAGSFRQFGGTHSAGHVYVGYLSTASGSYSLSSGSLVAALGYVGYGGTGNFYHSGGTASFGAVTLGHSSLGQCTYSLSGSAVLLANWAYVAWQGTASILQALGSVSVSTLFLAYQSGSSGVYSLAGGNLAAAAGYIGNSGAATCYHAGGTHSFGSLLSIGVNALGSGTYSLSGSALLTGTGDTRVGDAGTGSFLQSGGTHSIGHDLALAASGSTSRGTYQLSGGLLAVAETAYIGQTGTGSLYQSGGTFTTGLLVVGPTDTYSISSGTLATGGIVNTGAFVLGGTSALFLGGYSDLANATFQNLSRVSVTLQPAAVLVVPLGFNTASFGTFSNPSGHVIHPGEDIPVDPGSTMVLNGSVSGFADCAGAITAYAGTSIHLNGGLFLRSASASAAFGNGTLRVENTRSGMLGGTLSAASVYIASAATAGAFTQSAGTHALTDSLYVGSSPGSSATYALASGLLNAGSAYVGSLGAGALLQSNGTVSLGGTLYLSYLVGSSGYYSLAGGNLLAATAYVGYLGPGTLLQSDGSVSLAGALSIGTSTAGSDGFYALSNGRLTAASITVGTRGSLAQSGGTVSIATLSVAASYTATVPASYSLGAGALQVSEVRIGTSNRWGAFGQSGGTHAIAATLYLGHSSGAAGTYSLTGGLLSAGSEYLGYAGGDATFIQSGGTHQFTGDFVLAQNGSSSAFYSLSGSAQLSSNGTGSVFIASLGAATFWQSGGTYSLGDNVELYLAGTGARGTYALSGSALLSAPAEQIAAGGEATFTQSGGSHSVRGALYLAPRPGAAGLYELLGGALSASQLCVGGSSTASGGTGQLSIAGGALTVTSSLAVYSPAAFISLAAGTLATGTLDLAHDPARLRWSGGTLRLTDPAGLAPSLAGPFGAALTLDATKSLQIDQNLDLTDLDFQLTLAGGALAVGSLDLTGHPTGLAWTSGSLAFTGPTGLILSVSGPFGSALTLGASQVLSVAQTLTLAPGAALTQTGGTLAATTLVLATTAAYSGIGTLHASTLTNAGTFRVDSGNLILHATTFANSGTLAVNVGSNLFLHTASFTQAGALHVLANGSLVVDGPFTNAAAITLAGGTLATPALTNTASAALSGFGQLSGSLLNHGSVDFYGPTQITGSLSNYGSFTVENNQTLIVGPTVNYGTIHTYQGTVIFRGGLTNYGAILTDPSSVYFSSLTVASSGYLVASPSDRFLLSGDFVSGSTHANWNTREAQLRFYGGGSHDLDLTAHTAPFAWDDLTLDPGNALSLRGGTIIARTLNVQGSATLVSGAMVTTALDLTKAAKLDLTHRPLVLQATSSAALATHRSALQSYLVQGGASTGAWSGTAGITSSAAANQYLSHANHAYTALALVKNADLPVPFNATDRLFQGQTTNAYSLLVQYTYVGDANLDGVISMDDYLALDSAYRFGLNGRGWAGGDFNYDGLADATDYALMDYVYLNQAGPLAADPLIALHTQQLGEAYTAAWSALDSAAVPEPASLSLLLLGGSLLLRRAHSRRVTKFEEGCSRGSKRIASG